MQQLEKYLHIKLLLKKSLSLLLFTLFFVYIPSCAEDNSIKINENQKFKELIEKFQLLDGIVNEIVLFKEDLESLKNNITIKKIINGLDEQSIDKTLDYLNDKDFTDKIGRKEQSKIELFKAKLYTIKEQDKKAEELYKKSIKFDKNFKNTTIYANFLEKHYSDNEASIKIRKTILHDLNLTNSQKAETLDSLAWLYQKQKNYEKAEEGHEKALIIYQELAKNNTNKHISKVAGSINSLADLYIEQGKYKKAEEGYKKALNIYQELAKNNINKYNFDVIWNFKGLANSYVGQKKYKEAKKACKQALRPYLIKEYIEWIEFYKKQNRYKKTENVYNETLKLYKSLVEVNPKVEVNPDKYKTDKNDDNLYVRLVLFFLVAALILYSIRYYVNLRNDTLDNYKSDQFSSKDYKKLKTIKKELKYLFIFQEVLESSDISEEIYEKAINFAYGDNEKRVKIFSERIGAKFKKEGEFYRITLPADFPLQIGNFLLFITKMSAKEVKNKLDTIPDKVLVINDDFVVQNKLYTISLDKTNRIIAPKPDGITKILLDSNPIEKLVDILVEHLLLKDISPYQTNDGINSEANFFGMKEIISSIINTEPKNYIIVGGRQLGKSSLLKALFRRYTDKDDVDSYYITLSSSDIVREICDKLGLENSTIEELEKFVLDAPKRIVFLIDEADKFIKEEKENDYKITESFRKLSQEGKANFIITGFWTLYNNVYNDYQAPLKNFGEIIKIEGLEKEACSELIIKPMKRVGIYYEYEKDIDLLIKICGQRANLIAITCSEILKQLDGKVIKNKDIDQVIKNKNLDDDLKGWGALSSDKKANRLDRIIIYLTLQKEKFRLKDITEGLKENNLTVDIVDVEDSLNRLTLAYVIGKRQGNYFYRVPIFVEKMLENDIEILLDGDVEEYKLT